MGLAHTRRRSRLDLQGVRNIVGLKKTLMHDFAVDNTRSTRLKGKFRDFEFEGNPEATGITFEKLQTGPGIKDVQTSVDGDVHEFLLEDEPDYEVFDSEVFDEPQELFSLLIKSLIDEVAADMEAMAALAEPLVGSYCRIRKKEQSKTVEKVRPWPFALFLLIQDAP